MDLSAEEISEVWGQYFKFDLTNIDAGLDMLQDALADKFPHAIWFCWIARANDIKGIQPKLPYGTWGLYVGYMTKGMISPTYYYWSMTIPDWNKAPRQKLLPRPNNLPTNLDDQKISFNSNDPNDEEYLRQMRRLMEFIKQKPKGPETA